MEAYRIYLRAYVTASGKLEVNIQGAELKDLAACTIAIHDAMHGREPRSAEDVTSAVDRMLKEPASCA